MTVTKSSRHLSRHLLTAVVAVGAISASTVTLAGPAGATSPTAGHSRTAVMGHKELARAVTRECTRTRRRLHQEARLKARFEKRLNRLKGWEAKATAEGHAPRVAALQGDIVRVRALRNRALLSKSVARDSLHAKALGPACAAFARSVQAKEKAARAARIEARAKARGIRAARVKAAAAARAGAATAQSGARPTTGTTSTPTTSTTSPAPITAPPTTSAPASTAPTTTSTSTQG